MQAPQTTTPTQQRPPLMTQTDDYHFKSAERDVARFCKLFNDCIATLSYLGLLYGQPDEDTLREIAAFRSDKLKAAITAAHEECAATLPRSLRNLDRYQTVKECADAEKVVADFAFAARDTSLNAGLRTLTAHECSTFLTFDQGKAQPDRDAILAAYTETVPDTPEASAFIEEARRLFEAIRDFNARTLALSGGYVIGVGNRPNGYSVIYCDEDEKEAEFEERALFHLDFAAADDVQPKD